MRIVYLHHNLVVIILFAVAFLIRLYASTTVPLTEDEEKRAGFSKQISFEPNNLNIPIGTKLISSSILSVYIVKMGFSIFGESKVGGRFFFVILGILSIYFIYKLVREILGAEESLLALLLLTFEQYHIGLSRLIDENILSLFFSSLIIYLFFKALRTQEKKWVYLTGISLGLGFHGKVLIILLLPVLLIFILSEKKYRLWLIRKETYLAIMLMFLIISPYVWWSIKNSFNICAERHLTKIGISLRAFYLYFAEVFAWVTEKLNLFVWGIYELEDTVFIKLSNGELRPLSIFSNEFPFVHWVLGVLIFISIFYSLKKYNRNKELIRFSLIMFIYIFVTTSFVAGSESLLDRHVWATMTLYPGVILCSYMLIKLKERYRYARFAITGLIIYSVVYSIYFINIPENMFALPKNEICKYYLDRAEAYLEGGEEKEATIRCKWVLKRHPDKEISKHAEEILFRVK